MKKRIGFIWAVAALLVFVAGMGFGGPATASQSVDPCYKLCFMKEADQSLAQKQDCNRRCKASDRYKCDSKCIKTIGNRRSSSSVARSVSGCPAGGDRSAVNLLFPWTHHR